MHDRGIEVAYTEDLSDPKAETPGNHDVSNVYANTGVLPTERGNARLDDVAGLKTVKSPDDTAAVVMAVSVERPE